MASDRFIGLSRSTTPITEKETISLHRVSLDQLPVGAVGAVTHLQGAVVRLGQSGIVVGVIVQVISMTPRGSVIVQLTSGEQIALNRSLAQCIYISCDTGL